jgi:hypothetical protein
VKALTLRQPWAWMIATGIVRADGVTVRKTIENRRWNTSFRGQFLIHAAKGMTRGEYDEAIEWIADEIELGTGDRALAFPRPDKLKRSGIVGLATLVDVIPPCKPDLFGGCKHLWHMPEQYGFILEDIKPLPFVAMNGALGFHNVPDDVLRAIALGTDEQRVKRLNDVGLCACESEVEDPGPHLPSCPWSDPDYEGP